VKSNKRIELSVDPVKVNSGLTLEMMKQHGRIVRGQILSVEDHGCLVELGAGSAKGFLSFDNVQPTYKVLPEDDEDEEEKDEDSMDEDKEDSESDSDSDDSDEDDSDDDDDSKTEEKQQTKKGTPKDKSKKEELPPQIFLNKGRIFDFLIHPSSSTSGASIIQLILPSTESKSQTVTSFLESTPTTTDHSKGKRKQAAPPPTQQQHTIHSLNAGMLVKSTVEHYAKNGLCVSFLGGLFRGSIDLSHLGGFTPPDNLLEKIAAANRKRGERKKNSKNNNEQWYKQVFTGRLRHVMARIIMVDPVTKIIRLSLLPHVLFMEQKAPKKLQEVCCAGDVFHNARVVRLDNGIGALLALPYAEGDDDDDEDDEDDAMEEDTDDEFEPNTKKIQNKKKKKRSVFTNLRSNEIYDVASKVKCVYVHISKAMDPPSSSSSDNNSRKKNSDSSQASYRTPEALFAKHFALNSIIPSIRVLSTSNTLESIHSATAAPSAVQAHVFTYGDIEPGRIYKDVQVITHFDGGSMLVQLGQGVKGIIPLHHLFDKATGDENKQYRIQTKLKKYPVNSKMDAVRCLTIDSSTRKCVLTAKKALLTNNIDNPITSYNPKDIKLGTTHYGVVTQVSEKGVVVTFYNNVRGFVSAKQMAEELGVEDPKLNYRVGQIIKTRVTRANEKSSKLFLSLKINSQEEEKKKKGDDVAVTLEAGLILPAKSMTITSLVPSKTISSSTVVNGEEKGETYMSGFATVTVKLKYFKRHQLDKSISVEEGKKSGTGSIECKLPYSQLLDHYEQDVIKSSSNLNKFANGLLKVGKKINQEGMVITQTQNKSGLQTISLKPILIETAKKLDLNKETETDEKKTSEGQKEENAILLPSPKTFGLFTGATVQGYVARKDVRYGSFIDFLDSYSGLIPKLKGGLDVKLYDTITCKITAIDMDVTPPKILLKRCDNSEKETNDAKKGRKEIDEKKMEKSKQQEKQGPVDKVEIKPGDIVEGDIKILSVSFTRLTMKLLHPKYKHWKKVNCRMHMTMAKPSLVPPPSSEEELDGSKKERRQKRKQEQKRRTKNNSHDDNKITKYHPFYNYKVGDIVSPSKEQIKCVSLDVRDRSTYLELTDRTAKTSSNKLPPPVFVDQPHEIQSGNNVTAIVTQVISPSKSDKKGGASKSKYGGLRVQVCPSVFGFVSALEVTNSMEILQDLNSYFPIGCSVTCRVLGVVGRGSARTQEALDLSILQPLEDQNRSSSKNRKRRNNRPNAGDLVLGTIDRTHRSISSPSLMIRLRGGYVGRCDITELDDRNDWANMPLGQCNDDKNEVKEGATSDRPVVTDDEEEHKEVTGGEERMDIDKEEGDGDESAKKNARDLGDYPHGKLVQCIVLSSRGSSKKSASHTKVIEVSIRKSRILNKELLEDDYDTKSPEPGDIVHAYVVTTGKMGCFVRISRSVEGRVQLKQLTDAFLPDPVSAFPPGRLVVGKVKGVKKGNKGMMVDLDLRETTLLEAKDKLTFEDIKVGSKYKGHITRIEPYGVFVHIENSHVSGLAHLSECSDDYIKNLSGMYYTGDFVKALVIKTDEETKRVGFSLKASHFADDSDSDDSSSSSDSSDESDSAADDSDDSDDDDEVQVVKTSIDLTGSNDEDSMDSDDENYASKLATKLETAGKKSKDKVEKQRPPSESSDSDEASSDSDSDSDDDDDSDDSDSSHEVDNKVGQTMDTDVGFDWGGQASADAKRENTSGNDSDSSSDDSSDDDEDDNEDNDKKKASHKSRKKAAAKRREEKEISLRESALADGTADENPETSADFERLLASDPNNSESWIKYMAFHLSLADIDSARSIANRAFDRIEFRQEREKLNVWTALLTLELKYGSSKSLQDTIDRACQHNNPKQVYMRVCEMLEREVEAAKTGNASSVDEVEAINRADEMFARACKKFKSKKTVWISHLTYLLKNGRHTEAHALLKRALLSLAQYKHVETMSKFAQLEFEYGSAERARTIFDGLLEKHPKKMDLVFVYVDKEVKNGEIQAARNLFERIVNPPTEADPQEQQKKKKKMSDKQMKALFKKWYRMEEIHGDDETCDHVKESARTYVERSTASKS